MLREIGAGGVWEPVECSGFHVGKGCRLAARAEKRGFEVCPMKGRWSDKDADALTRDYAARGVAEDVAIRVYSSRLLGRDGRLVLHGGGNTSVKTRMTDAVGEETDVLCVKGSGWDLAEIEPAGLPAVRMGALRGLRRLEALSDEDMVNVQRAALLDSSAPNPSVETLLHAFLPHKFVDHTHADAILAVTDSTGGRSALPGPLRAAGGSGSLRHAGFRAGRGMRARSGRAAGCRRPDSRQARHIQLRRNRPRVIRTHDRAGDGRGTACRAISEGHAARAFAPVRGAGRGSRSRDQRGGRGTRGRRLAAHDPRIPRLEARSRVCRRMRFRAVRRGRSGDSGPRDPDETETPDPARRTSAAIRGAVAGYARDYQAYFRRNDRRNDKLPLDPMPRVVLVPGLGLFGLGKSAREARIAADLAETTARVVVDAERIGRYESVPSATRSMSNTGRWSRRSSARRRKNRWRGMSSR